LVAAAPTQILNHSTGLPPKPGKPEHRKTLPAEVVAEKAVRGGERRTQNVKDKDVTGTWQLTVSATDGHTPWEGHQWKNEDKKALPRAAAQHMTNATAMDPNASSSSMGFPESHTRFDPVIERHPPSASKSTLLSLKAT